MSQLPADSALPPSENLPGCPQPEPRRRFSPLRLAGTLLSIGLLVYLILLQGWDEFAAALARVPAHTFWICVALMFGSRLCVALRWFVLLRSARVKISFWQTLRLVFMGLFATNFLPSTIGGDLVRMAGAVALRVDAGVAAASLVLDRLVGMAGMSSLAPVGLAIVLRSSPQVSMLQAAGGIAGITRLPGAEWVISKLKRFFSSLRSSAAYWLKNPSSLLLALLFTYGHMLFTFLVIYLLLQGMGEPLSFWWVGGLWSLSYFISLAPFAINGLGLQELSISLLYSQYGGVSVEAGLALALFMRMLPLIASLPGALFLPDILRPPAAPPSTAPRSTETL